MFTRFRLSAVAALLLVAGALPAAAQIREVDPNEAIDADLAPRGGTTVDRAVDTPPVADPQADPYAVPADPYSPPAQTPPPASSAALPPPASGDAMPQPTVDGSYTATADATYRRDDLIGAAEGVFGKGAEGLAGIIENVLRDQGEPNAYIAGQEAGGAVVVGLRYGSGTMFHRVEGQRPVYWTGPSLGFDFGGDAAKTFVLVYNLYDSQELYKRFPQAEGRVYFVGGFSASYLRKGDVVLIPIRLGVGWRLGANVGYMKFSEKQRWLPF